MVPYGARTRRLDGSRERDVPPRPNARRYRCSITSVSIQEATKVRCGNHELSARILDGSLVKGQFWKIAIFESPCCKSRSLQHRVVDQGYFPGTICLRLLDICMSRCLQKPRAIECRCRWQVITWRRNPVKSTECAGNDLIIFSKGKNFFQIEFSSPRLQGGSWSVLPGHT